MRNTDIGGEVRRADEGRSPACVGAECRAATHAELQGGPPTRCLMDAGGLGCDERGVVEVVEKGGFEDLHDGQRSLHDRDRSIGVHHTTFFGRLDRYTMEVSS